MISFRTFCDFNCALFSLMSLLNVVRSSLFNCILYGHCVPFVLVFLPGKSDIIYRSMWSDIRSLSEIHNSTSEPTTVHIKVSKGAKIRNRYNQVPHVTQDTNGKVTNSQLDTTNQSQEVSSFPAGDHKAHTNRRAQRHSKHKTEQKHKRSTKEVPPWNGQ